MKGSFEFIIKHLILNDYMDFFLKKKPSISFIFHIIFTLEKATSQTK